MKLCLVGALLLSACAGAYAPDGTTDDGSSQDAACDGVMACEYVGPAVGYKGFALIVTCCTPDQFTTPDGVDVHEGQCMIKYPDAGCGVVP